MSDEWEPIPITIAFEKLEQIIRADEREKVLADIRLHLEKWQKAQHDEAAKQMNETMAAYMYGAARAYGDALDLVNGGRDDQR